MSNDCTIGATHSPRTGWLVQTDHSIDVDTMGFVPPFDANVQVSFASVSRFCPTSCRQFALSPLQHIQRMSYFYAIAQPLKLNPDTSWLDEVMGWSLAAFGAYFQVWYTEANSLTVVVNTFFTSLHDVVGICQYFKRGHRNPANQPFLFFHEFILKLHKSHLDSF